MGRSKSYDRNEVLGRAMHLFWRQGYRATSLSDLTAATGLNRKSLYAEFGSKAAIFEAALACYADQRRDLAQSWAAREPLGLHNIRDFFYALCDQAEYRGCLFTLSLNERETLHGEHVAYIKGVIGELERFFLANLVVDRAGPAKSECRKFARWLTVFMQGLMTVARADSRGRLRQMVDVAMSACIRRTRHEAPQ